ncbi:MAG: ATP-binding cassette domain-containing protein, partial [Planctomycetota bacterium]
IPPLRRNRAWHLSAALGPQAPGGAALGVDALSLEAAEPGRPPLLEGLRFELGAGEILGLAGLLGSGRTELLSSLFGVFGKRVHGSITIAGSSTRIRDIRHAMELGLALIPEDRARLGLVPDRDLRDNFFLASSRQRLGVLRGAEERGVFERQATELRLKHADWRQGVLELSGGNQQKVLLGRWIQCEPRILLLDEPTRGIDVGARDEIYRWIERLAREGKAILIATSELPELCRLADRILVLRQGRLVREVASADTSQAELLGWMAGAGRDAG